MSELLRIAQSYVDHGFVVIPLLNKRPIRTDWQKSLWEPQLPKDCMNCKSLGFMIPHDILVIDVDNKTSERLGSKSLQQLCDDYNFDFVANAGAVVETPTNGLHLYYSMVDMIEEGQEILHTVDKYKGIEFKSKGRQVVIPGSTLDNGGVYNFDIIQNDLSNLGKVPTALFIDLLRTKGNIKDEETVGFKDTTIDLNRFKNFLSKQPTIYDGEGRNNKLYSFAAYAKDLGLSPRFMAKTLLDWNNKNVIPPLAAAKLAEIISNAYHYTANSAGVSSVEAVFKDSDNDEQPIMLNRQEAEKQHEELKELTDWKTRLVYAKDGSISRAAFGSRNAEIFLENLPEFKDRLALNQFSSDTVWRKLPKWISKADIEAAQLSPNDIALTDDDVIRIRDVFNNYGFDPSGPQIIEAARAVSLKRPFHPVKEVFESFPAWDGQKRLEQFFPYYCGTRDSVYAREMGKKIFVAIVSRIYKPGCKFDYLPIFVGEQGIGKSTLIKLMAIRPTWFSDSLGDIENKDVILQMRSKLVIENGELTMFNKKEITSQKAFLSRATDRARLPYDKLPRDLPRQCVIISSTNEAKFLADETGNRRMWPIELIDIKLTEVARDIPQLYAEALLYFKKGEELYFDNPAAAAEAEVEQQRRFKHDEWQDAIQQWLIEKGSDFIHGTDIWEKCFGYDIRYYDTRSQKRISSILRVLGWRNTTKRVNDRTVHGYGRPIINQNKRGF